MNQIIQQSTPILVTFNEKSIIIHVSNIENYLYININSITSDSNKWKRGKIVSEKLKNINKKINGNSCFSVKNTGTWLIFSMIEDFGNWHKDGFGTFLNENLRTLFDEYIHGEDPYFTSLMYNDNRCIIRANRETAHINLTDILNIYKKDIRHWKQSILYKNYIQENPTYIHSGNTSLDEFGIRTSYGHPNIACLLLEWLYKNNKDKELYDTIIKFIVDSEDESESEDGNCDKSDKSEEDEDESEDGNCDKSDKSVESEEDESEIEDGNCDKSVESESEEEIIDVEIIQAPQSNELVFNNITIMAREDGYINATQMCKAGRKEFKHWKSLGSTSSLIQDLSLNVGIPTFKLFDVKQGRFGGSWIHPDLAVQLAQWISPQFALQVSRWVRELCMAGSVTLGREMLDTQLDQTFQNLLDIRPYDKNDIIYILSFVPTGEINRNLEQGEKYYKFGVTSDISRRLVEHEGDKMFSNVCMEHAFVCSNGFSSSETEKYTKRIVKLMNLVVEYATKKELFVATDDQIEYICTQIQKYLNNSTERPTDFRCPEERIIQYNLFRDDKVTFEQLEILLNRPI
jgi:hypothetical protein